MIHTDISVLRNNIIAHRKFNSDRQFILKEYQLSEKTIEKAYSILMNCLRNISENCENIFSLDTKNNLFKFNISTQAEYLMSQVYSLNEEKSISKHFFPYHTEA